MRKTSSTLIAIILTLLSLGIVMLASTSSVKASITFADPYYFFKRQVVWLLLSFIVGLLLIGVDYHFWKKFSTSIMIITVISLILVFVPGIGVKIGGSNRWLRFSGLSLQPSEFAKFTIIVALSSWMTDTGRHSKEFIKGFLCPLIGLSLMLGLFLMEPDFGTTLLVGVVGMIIMFVGGARLGYLSIAGVMGACTFILAIMHNPLRMGRILAFIMPEKYPASAYHLAQSKVAFIRGGWFGVGLGNSIQKQLYLPEAHTDFILAIIGEELGFIVTIIILALFLTLLICGLLISFKAPDPFGRLLGFGITIMIVLQAMINIGVVTGCLPTKGLPLPFISYGGSSLLVSVASISVLLNIARHCDNVYADDNTRFIKDGAHRL